MAQFTVAQIINIAKISQYLCVLDIAKSGYYGGGKDLSLPRKIYTVRKDIEYLYDLDPTDDTLPVTARFLYALCAPYNLAASNITGGGGQVTPITPATSYVYYVLPYTWSGAASDTLTHASLIGATDVQFAIVNDTTYQFVKGDFTVNNVLGTLTLAGGNKFFDGDAISVPMNKLV